MRTPRWASYHSLSASGSRARKNTPPMPVTFSTVALRERLLLHAARIRLVAEANFLRVLEELSLGLHLCQRLEGRAAEALLGPKPVVGLDREEPSGIRVVLGLLILDLGLHVARAE